MQKTQRILYKILAIIEYDKDKDKFVEEFETLIKVDALLNVVDTLPDNIKRKTEFNKEDYENLKRQVPQEEFSREVEKITEKELKKYIAFISPDLTEEQREQIEQLLRQQQSKRPHKNPLNFLTRITKKIFR